MPLVIEQFGDECMMYASDYPHWDTEWPHTVSQVVRRKDISDKTKQKILAGQRQKLLPFFLIVLVTDHCIPNEFCHPSEPDSRPLPSK